MTPEQLTAILVSIAAVLVAVARCIAEVRAYNRGVTAKLDEVAATAVAGSYAAGVAAAQKAAGSGAALPADKEP